MSVDLLLATIDQMSQVLPSQVKDELTTTFVRAMLSMHRRSEEEFTDEQLASLAAAVCAFHDEDVISGREAEELYYNVYQSVYKREVGQETEDWSGEVDWQTLVMPKSVLRRIATAAASQDAANTKAFFRYCEQNPV